MLVNLGRRYVRYLGRRRRVKIRRKYFFGRRKKPIRRFRRKLRIMIKRKYRKIRRVRRRWRVRIRRNWCRLRRFGRKWYVKRRRKWTRLRRVRLFLKQRRQRIRIRRRKKKWYARRNKRWGRVRRRVRCSIRIRRKRVRVKLIGKRNVRIFRKGRYGKTRRIRFTRELIQINIPEYDRNRIKTEVYFELYKSLVMFLRKRTGGS